MRPSPKKVVRDALGNSNKGQTATHLGVGKDRLDITAAGEDFDGVFLRSNLGHGPGELNLQELPFKLEIVQLTLHVSIRP